MIKKKYMILTVLIGFTLNSCCEDKVIKVYPPKYKFEKIDTTGSYIELKDRDTRRVCSPSLNKLNTVYTGIIEFYDWQIDEYDRLNNDRRNK